MCDFLVSLGKRHSGKDLLNLIKKPYGSRAPEGKFFDFSWGSIAVLFDQIANNKNILARNGLACCWIGDLVMADFDRSFERLIKRITELNKCGEVKANSLRTDGTFEKLNGAFVILIAGEEVLSIITDPLDFTPVFIAKKKGGIAALGTHPDLVATISGNSSKLDRVSVGEFINIGTPSFPNTMYENVKQLRAGSVHRLKLQGNQQMAPKEHTYWQPPKEMREGYNENEKELAEELAESFLAAVRDRCRARGAGVLLSGGLDSRLIMASVPPDLECMGFTFCDYPNREMRTAQKIAKCYNRRWYPLVRDKEYIGNNIVDTVMFTGCEYDWIHAHSLGFEDVINSSGVDVVFNGAWVGCFLRAPLADEWIQVNRLGGILPAKYRRETFEYVNKLTPFLLQNVKKPVVEQVRARRQSFYKETVEAGRGSLAEWLEENPITQRPEISAWAVERRVFPARSVGVDKRLLDFSFRCPVELKLGNRIFLKAALNVYGPSVNIADANDGVRPGSSHWPGLAQRAVRKFQDRTGRILARLGKEPRVQHSWHDYQKYWQESNKLAQLISEFGSNLDEFDGQVFEGYALDLLKRKDIDWRSGFRLLQLAVWRGITKGYRL